MQLSDKYLGTLCTPVPAGENVSATIKGMLALCYDEQGAKIGIGLAANQAGVNKRIIVVNYCDPETCMINPVIEKYRGGTFNSMEGCLSFPEQFVKVVRHKIIKLSWYDENWTHQSRVVRGLLATIVQHEIDHLDGITIFDRERLGAAE